jgi:hypothetical protein
MWWCGPHADPPGGRWSTDVTTAALYETEAEACDAFGHHGRGEHQLPMPQLDLFADTRTDR